MNTELEKKIRFAVRSVVVSYSHFDSFSDCYSLCISDVPEWDILEITSLFMQDNAYANETTSCDNPEYEKSMLPALRKYLYNIIDEDAEKDFLIAWKEGCASYFKKNIQEMIDDECANYCRDFKHEKITLSHHYA